MRSDIISREVPTTEPKSRAPFVSVIIPLYNKQDHIAATIASVIIQNFPEMEVIVVNDGSTDGSEDAVRPFLDKIRYFSQTNTGPSAARNLGIEMARGRFIAFLDADDRWLFGKISAQIDFLQQHPDIMWCGCNLIYENIKPGQSQTAVSIETHGLDWVVFDDWFSASLDKALSQTPCVVIRREVIERVGMFDPTIPAGQDMDYWIRIATCFPRYGYCYQPMVHVINWLPGSVSRNCALKFPSMLLFLNRHIERARQQDLLGRPIGLFLRHKLMILIRLSLRFGLFSIAREAIEKTPTVWRDSDWRKLRLICQIPSWVIRIGISIRNALLMTIRSIKKGS